MFSTMGWRTPTLQKDSSIFIYNKHGWGKDCPLSTKLPGGYLQKKSNNLAFLIWHSNTIAFAIAFAPSVCVEANQKYSDIFFFHGCFI